MAWGRSKIILMRKDPTTKRQEYSAKSYQWVLEECLLSIYQPGDIFQQDNAPIHTAKAIQELFECSGIHVSCWPPHSPDLNPIEHVWKLFKDSLHGLFPGLFNLRIMFRYASF